MGCVRQQCEYKLAGRVSLVPGWVLVRHGKPAGVTDRGTVYGR